MGDTASCLPLAAGATSRNLASDSFLMSLPAARGLHHGLPDVLLGVQDDDVQLRREHARYRHGGR